MSVELEVQRVSLVPANIDHLVSAWLVKSRVQAQSVRLPDDIVELFIDGASIRGFSVHRRWAWFRNRIWIRLSVCASQGDWRAAYSFLRFARQRGFDVSSDDGIAIGDDCFADEAASNRSHEQFAWDVGFLRRFMASSNDEAVFLPTGRFSVPVRLGELPPEPLTADALEKLESTLLQRATKYASARWASVITLKTGEKAVVWSGEPLLAAAVDHVVLSRGEFDPATCVYVPWARAISELSDAAEEILRNPSHYYFDAVTVDDARWHRLVRIGVPIDQLGRV